MAEAATSDAANSSSNSNSTRSVDEIANYLQNTVAEESWKRGQPDTDTVKYMANAIKQIWNESSSPVALRYLMYEIKEEQLDVTVKELVKFLQNGSMAGTNVDQKERQFVGISHKVMVTVLTHDFDMLQLKGRITIVFCTFYEEENTKGYYGPYICFVQSSGMGKTKILYELCKYYNENTDIVGRLILCRSAKLENEEQKKETDLFDGFIDLRNDSHRKQSFNDVVQDVFSKLETMVSGMAIAKKTKKLVLFFDEAHYLLDKGTYANGSKSMDAMLFRIVRLWIRKNRGFQIVAVFTGTTAKLTNFIIEDDIMNNMDTDTREYTASKNKDEYYERGKKKSYAPFYTTTTIGCLRHVPRDDSSSNKSEYSVAVPRGRPLFAAMSEEELKAGEANIIQRIVQDPSPTAFEKKKTTWLSVLGTRVQMGQTTFEVASRLVGRSYANLVSVSPATINSHGKQSAKICFPPDPVCARLAMCLMDKDWSMELPNRATLEGREKTWWVQKMKLLFSKEFCEPEKGDFGEIMVALYFLFCADGLRSRLRDNKDYTTFSVPLDQWINCLINGGSTEDDNADDSVDDNMMIQNDDCQCHFSAIQVCRNFVRAYDDSWSSLKDGVFLENMYKTGVGFYVFAGCSVIDLVFALRVSVTASKEGSDPTTHTASSTQYNYIPMLVSIKSRTKFCPKAASIECDKMKAKLETTEFGALCLLVVFGSHVNSNDNDYTLNARSVVKELAKGDVVSKVLRIPTNDKYGLSESFLGLTEIHDEMSEALASHSFLGAHREADSETNADDFTERILRLRKREKDGSRRPDHVTTTVAKLIGGLDEIIKGKSSGVKKRQRETYPRAEM